MVCCVGDKISGTLLRFFLFAVPFFLVEWTTRLIVSGSGKLSFVKSGNTGEIGGKEGEGVGVLLLL
jgi:hypothetical protein